MNGDKQYAPSGALARSFEKALGTANGMRPQVEYLEELAKVCPEIDPSCTECRVMLEHLDRMCRVGLRHTVPIASQPSSENQ